MPRFQSVPTVDLESYVKGSPKEKAEFVQLFGDALKEFGFIKVEGHGIPSELVHDCYKKAQMLFSLPEEIKKSYEVTEGGGQRGYVSFGREQAKDAAVADLKEFWHVGRESFLSQEIKKEYPENVWPKNGHVPGFQDAMGSLYSQLEEFAKILLEATSVYMGLEPQLLPNLITDGNSILRALHYPPLAEGQFQEGAVRAAAHEDINLITILCEATESGLELLTRDGRWLSVESGPGQMVVDSGDMLSRMLNEIIPSTTHRVVNPSRGTNKSRYSMPFFVHPYSSADLTVLRECCTPSRPARFAPSTAGEFLEQRLAEIGLRK